MITQVIAAMIELGAAFQRTADDFTALNAALGELTDDHPQAHP